MVQIFSSEEKKRYDIAWFEERAFRFLKPIKTGVWDFSDSLLLYVPKATQYYESIQKDGESYGDSITKLETEYLKNIASEVVKELPDDFDYVDLGPGTAYKEQYIFDEAKRVQKRLTYVPVDISSDYLQSAAKHAVDQGIEVVPILSSFEELPELLRKRNTFKFVSIGLTFGNYEPVVILQLLKRIIGSIGYAFINVQMRDRVDMTKMREVYEQIFPMTYAKLGLLGLSREDIFHEEVDDGIRIWCTLRRSNPRLESIGVHAGDKLLLLQSLRQTKQSLEETIALEFPTYMLFDHGDPFVGALLKV